MKVVPKEVNCVCEFFCQEIINAKIFDLLFAGIVYEGAQVSQLVTPRPPSSVSQAAVK